MLSQLYIKNVAVISEAAIDLSKGLNVFTGETGAGKTILINAINAVLGERTSKEIIRTGEERAEISALFDDLGSRVSEELLKAGYPPDEDGALLIHREIHADGKSSCRVNGRPATVSILKAVGGLLINVHGQHDNQQLLAPQKHIGFVDGFGVLEKELSAYRQSYRAWRQARQELESFETDEAEKAQKMDLLRFQVQEIEDACLKEGEEEELRAQRLLLQNSIDVTRSLGAAIAILDGDEEQTGLTGLLSQLMDHLDTAAKYLEGAQPMSERVTDVYYEMEDFSGDIQRLLDGFDTSTARLDAVEERLDVIYKLKKKYGADAAAVIAYGEKAARALEQLENADAHLEKLRVEAQKLEKQARRQAQALSEKRLAAAREFTKAVQEELTFLDMPSVRLTVKRTEKPLSPDGIDEIELFIAANVGEEAKSLSKVASGGELSRIMLSIKNVMADRDAVQTMIFDEIDTGVSGRAAQKIGRKLKQVAQNRQVIVVTHLAQVASYASHHLFISKSTRDNRTYTTIAPLSGEARVRELARITAGDKITDLALRHAEEMLRDAENE